MITAKTILNIGDRVTVNFPGGEKQGNIFDVKEGYKQLTNETCYEVHGKGFVTITSANTINKDVQ